MEAAVLEAVPFKWKVNAYSDYSLLQDLGRRHGNQSIQFDGRRLQKNTRLQATTRLQRSFISSSRSLSLKPVCCHAVSEALTDIHGGCNNESILLKKKAAEIRPVLSGKNVFLVGMMGSGKSTVGKILAEALDYEFCDSDKLVEEDSGGKSVAEIFKYYREEDFRNSESKVLRRLSTMPCLVVATGGGAVIRGQNWTYMKKGITILLNVPLEALAARVVAVGVDSRPLLGQASADCYTKALAKLTKLYEERAEAYANSDIILSLKDTALRYGYKDLSILTPTIIAIEALRQIGDLLKNIQ